MYFSAALLALPAFAAAFNTHHVAKRDAVSHGRKRLSAVNSSLSVRGDGAQFTNYKAGLGACGQTNGDNDHIVAISAQIWNGGSHCGDQVSITVGGKTVQATVMDECMGCDPNHIDLTIGLFQSLGNLDDGVLHGSFSLGGDKKAQDDADKKKADEEAAKKKQQEEADAKKKADEDAARKKQEEEDAKKKAADDAAKSSSAAAAAAAKTSSSSSASSSAAPTSSAAAASSPTAATGDAIAQANLLLLQMAGMGVLGYKH